MSRTIWTCPDADCEREAVNALVNDHCPVCEAPLDGGDT